MSARRIALGALIVALLSAGAALAWKRTRNQGGVELFWSQRGHPFTIDGRGSPAVPPALLFPAIRQSFAAWAAIGCSDLTFPETPVNQDPSLRRVGYFPGQTNQNLVLFRTAACRDVVPAGDACLRDGGCGNLYDCWDHDELVLAITTTTSNRFTGQISDADIELNGSPATDGTSFRFTAVDGPACTATNQTGCVAIDVQNTVTHEAGHSVGLDHTTDASATMYASAPPGETSKRTPHPDDVAAICSIYPKGAETTTSLGDPVVLRPVQAGGGCAAGGEPAVWGLLALCAWILKARRRGFGR